MVSHDFVTSHRKTYDSHYSRKSIEHDSFNNAFRTAATELRIQKVVRFPTGCKSLDNLLDGGIEVGVITQVYGPPGSGKTQLCHTLCTMLSPDYSAIYIDTEGSFRPERIKEIANARGLNSKQILQRILVTKALDIKELESRIEAACSKIGSDNKIKLLIVDSIIYHYRAEYSGRSKLPGKIQRLNKSMHALLKIASSKTIAVVVTNHQMQSSVDGFDNRVVPLGGNVMSYATKYRIHVDGRSRRANLEVSPSHPQSDTYFAIEDRGFSDVADD